MAVVGLPAGSEDKCKRGVFGSHAEIPAPQDGFERDQRKGLDIVVLGKSRVISFGPTAYRL